MTSNQNNEPTEPPIVERFVTKKHGTVEMGMDELCRWCCLVEAIDIIDKKATQLGIDKSKSTWVKTIAIQKYIDDRLDTMTEEVTRQFENYPLYM